ncbi:MAG: glycosyltransferase family 4 protein [Parabacteroides sp.]
MERLKIFVSAYACEPDLGSEIGVGWHWVLEMSKYFELWVLTRESNRHTIEPWIAAHPDYAHIHWLYYDWPKWARWWKKGLRGVRTYYNLWQISTNRIVKRTMIENDISIFHHLTYGNVLWKVSAYGQKQFFIWGPVGGLESLPQEFSKHYDRKSQLIESLRRVAAKFAKYNVGLRRSCRNANLILCKTKITQQALPKEVQTKSILFTDVATDLQIPKTISTHTDRPVTEFISVGHLDAWRGFDLTIEAIAKAAKECPDIHLIIVGNGPDKNRLKALIDGLHVEKQVTLAGKVPMEVYRQLMQKADVVVNAALKEGAVTVSFDAMAMGKPLICLDTTGYTRYFNNDYAILIPRTRREEVIEKIKEGMIRLTDREERQRLGDHAQTAAQTFSWEQHGLEIRNAILSAYHTQQS